MIEKLSQRIFMLIMVALSITVLGIIILFAVFNYNNTINTTTLMMDRFEPEDSRKNMDDRIEGYKAKPEINIEGVYNVLIENSKIVQNSNAEDINEYALKVSRKNSNKGIIGKYIYKIRRINNATMRITFIENEQAILHIRIMIISSIAVSIISIIIIYIVSKRLSKIIVKPVQETLEKQKQFISDASHELKTPLAVIEANADVIENEIGMNKWIKYIQNEIDSMNNLISELLLLAKVENVNSVKEYSELNLSMEVELIISMFESVAYEKQIRIKSDIAKDIKMNGNKEDVEHIVSTLIDNAIKHTEPHNEVFIVLKKEKNEIILEVKNMGKPIPENEREKIFERFYQIDKARNRKEKRYGLGLSIAKSVVEKYNGKIESLYKNNLTIFRVSIPM